MRDDVLESIGSRRLDLCDVDGVDDEPVNDVIIRGDARRIDKVGSLVTAAAAAT